VWLACGCIRYKDFMPDSDPAASKQRCRTHGQQKVERYES